MKTKAPSSLIASRIAVSKVSGLQLHKVKALACTNLHPQIGRLKEKNHFQAGLYSGMHFLNPFISV